MEENKVFDKKSITVRYYDKKGVLLETFTHTITGGINCYGHWEFDAWPVRDYMKRAPKKWNRFWYADTGRGHSGRYYGSHDSFHYRYQQDHANSLSPAEFADYQSRGMFPKHMKQAV